MKKVFSMLVAAFVTAGALVASAQQTQSALASSVANTAVVQDQSKLPSQDNRQGYLIAWFDVENNTDVAASANVDLGPYLPAGTAVVGGYAHVVEALLPAASATNVAVSIQAAGDLLPAGNQFASTGLKALVPSGSSTVLASATPQSAVVAAVTSATAQFDTISVITNLVLEFNAGNVTNVIAQTANINSITNVANATANVNSITNIATTTASALTAGNSVVVTGATSKVTIDLGSTAPTSGVVMVYLDLVKVQ